MIKLKKDRSTFIIIGICLFLVGILIAISIHDKFDEKLETKKVPCYDKYGNEMVGQFCLEQQTNVIYLVWVLFCGLFLFIGLIAILHGGFSNDFN